MVITKLVGGLGNQLFQYATGYALSVYRNTSLAVDINWYQAQNSPVVTKRAYALSNYSLPLVIARQKDIDFLQGKNSIFSRIVNRISTKKLNNTKYVYREPSFQYNPDLWKALKDTYLDGYWQSYRYFANHKQILIHQLVPNITGLDKKVAGLLPESESISVHIRRGDYVTSKVASSFHGFLGLEYYQKALAYFHDNLGSCATCVVFSDDIQWAQENFKTHYAVKFVQSEMDSNGCFDLYAMSKCKHHIVANSSFSWWGAWLCNNPDQIVVAPKQWFATEEMNQQTQDLCPESWIRL